MATNPPSIVIDPQLAATERATAQQIPLHLSTAVNGLSSLLVQRGQPSTPVSVLSPSTAAILTEIFQSAARAMEPSSSSTASEKAKEAAEKAKTWAIVGAVFAVVAAIILVVIAIVVTVFSFGSGAPAALSGAASLIGVSVSSAVGSIANLMIAAAQKGHPLAGRFSAAVSQIPRTLQDFTRASRYDSVALDAALRSILQSMATIEDLGRESAQMTGRCTGDPDAVYQCAQQIAPLLSRLAEILQTMRLLASDQTQTAIRTLQTATVVLTKPRLPK